LAGFAGVVELGEARDRVREAAVLLEAGELHTVELHAGDLGEHLDEALLDDLEGAERLAELRALLAIGERRVVRRDRVAERAPGARRARGDEHAARVLELVRPRKARGLRDAHAVEADVGLPDRARGALAGDRRRVVARRVGLDEEALDLAVLVGARPDDDDVGDRAVADPALGAVEDPAVAVATGARLERDGVRAVGGFG